MTIILTIIFIIAFIGIAIVVDAGCKSDEDREKLGLGPKYGFIEKGFENEKN